MPHFECDIHVHVHDTCKLCIYMYLVYILSVLYMLHALSNQLHYNIIRYTDFLYIAEHSGLRPQLIAVCSAEGLAPIHEVSSHHDSFLVHVLMRDEKEG